MSTVRVTLTALGFPNIAPNCLVVLQSLLSAGYRLVMKDVHYKNKEAIIEYFHNMDIPVHFEVTRVPDVDIQNDYLRMNGKYLPFSSWAAIDHYLLQEGLYNRDSRFSYKPSYSKNKAFLCVNYGEATQCIDPVEYSKRSAVSKAQAYYGTTSLNNVTIVETSSLRIIGVVDKNGYERFRSKVYFNNEL